MNKPDHDTFFLYFVFGGPLVILVLPFISQSEKARAKTIVEGSLLFFITITLILLCRILVYAPVFGVLFSALSIFFFCFYVFCSIFLIYRKTENPDYDIPFLSYYSETILRR